MITWERLAGAIDLYRGDLLSGSYEEWLIPLRERLRQSRGALPLDVRSRAEFELGRVEGALNIAHTRLAARQAEIPRDRPLLVYCQTGARASSAASLLARLGHQVLYVDDDFGKRLPAPP